MDFEVIAEGLQFPEGPIAMPDGSVLVVEIKRGTLSRVTPEGKVEVVLEDMLGERADLSFGAASTSSRSSSHRGR